MLNKLANMAPGEYRKSSWIDEFRESDKYVGSFALEVKLDDGRILQAWVRPSAYEQFYSVVLNNVFLGHLKKDPEWQDLTGKKTRIISLVGECIDKHLKQ